MPELIPSFDGGRLFFSLQQAQALPVGCCHTV